MPVMSTPIQQPKNRMQNVMGDYVRFELDRLYNRGESYLHVAVMAGTSEEIRRDYIKSALQRWQVVEGSQRKNILEILGKIESYEKLARIINHEE